MIDDSAAQSPADQPNEGEIASSDDSDTALLEDALQDALEAHAEGLLAAPFGVDELALARARQRAAEADRRRQDGRQPGDSRSDSE